MGETLSVEPIAIMFRKNDPAFKKAVDDAIAQGHDEERCDLAKMYDKWFVQPIPPTNTSFELAGQRRHQGRLGQRRTTSRWKDFAKK